MSAHRVPALSARYIVRPEIKDSVLRLLDAEAESFGDGDQQSSQELGGMFVSLAKIVRADKPIDLLTGTSHPTTAALEVTLAIRHGFAQVSADGDEPQDWHYLSDLAALAADIEAVA